MLSCCLQMQFDDVHTTKVSNDTCPHKGFDFLIANLLEGLHMSLISPSTIREWNKHNSIEVETIFEFSFYFLYDDAHTLLFVFELKNGRFDV